MSVVHTFDASQRLLCLCYSGRVTIDEIVDMMYRWATDVQNSGDISVLNLLDESADFFDIDLGDVFKLRDTMTEVLSTHGVRRKRSAFVINRTDGALRITRLWRALHATNPSNAVPMELFADLDAACAFLECDPEVVRAQVKRALTVTQPTAAGST